MRDFSIPCLWVSVYHLAVVFANTFAAKRKPGALMGPGVNQKIKAEGVPLRAPRVPDEASKIQSWFPLPPL
jgi:hypothetical protein